MRAMRLAAFTLLTALSLLSYADGLPDLGDASQDVVSPQQERAIGQQTMFEIRASKQYLGDAEVNDYLNQLGYRLVSNSSEPSLEFEFFAINDGAINAFALPVGFVGVNTGLILLAQSESELASVLSHEISHVTQHHIARMISGQRYDTLASIASLAVAILAARSNPQASQAAVAGAQAGMMQRQLDFTRTNEQEADRIGLELLEKSGFDIHAMPNFFQRMQKATGLLEGNAPSYLRTHPLTSDRIADVDNRVDQLPYKLVADGLEFQLVRAKLHVLDKSPAEAVAYFESALGPQKFGNPLVQRYGLVLALLKNRQSERAAQEWSKTSAPLPPSPMLETLSIQLASRGKSDAENMAAYQKAMQRYPQHRALAYDYADLLLKNKRHADAKKLLDERILLTPNDPRLYELQARNYAALSLPQPSHRALAYALLLRGDLLGSIQQMEIARRSGHDPYQLAVIETELKQLNEMIAARKKKR